MIVGDTTAAILVAASIALAAFNWAALPQRLPIHYNFRGEPDGWGPKISVVMWPALAIVFFTLFTALPYALSHGLLPAKPGTDVGRAAEFLGLVRVDVIALFVYVEWATIEFALGRGHGPHVAAILAFVVVAAGMALIVRI